MVVTLSLKTLYGNKRRYALIALAVALGSALITLLSGAAYGALGAIEAKAARYFAGHVSITGYNWGWAFLSQRAELLENLAGSGLPIRVAAPRTVYYRDSQLLFGGEYVRQRRLVGIEFEREYDELRGLYFSEGALEAMLGPAGQDGILISRPAARLLGARVGDEVTLFLTTDSGQYNTATLVVRGVFEESSLFGYVSYMRNADLNRLLLREPDAATDLALYAQRGVDHRRLAEAVRVYLSASFKVFPPLPSKAELNAALYAGYEGEHLAVLSLDAHLAQIRELLDAFLLLTYFVLGVFAAVVMVGVLNTYRVIVYERTRELGTLRALGLGRLGVVGLLAFEALVLGLAAGLAGLAAGAMGFWALGLLDLSGLPAAGLFTERGRLTFYLDARLVAMNLGLLCLAVLAAALGPALRAGRISPAEAMRDAG